MKLGYSPTTAGILDLDQAWRLAVDLKLDFIELSADLHEALPEAQASERVRALTRATGVGVSVHLSYLDLNLASAMPLARANAVERTRAGLAFADSVEAIAAIAHPGRRHLAHPVAEAMALSALRASLAELPPTTTPLLLENVALTPEDLIRGPGELRDLCDAHGIGICFDVGHAHVEGGAEVIDAYLTTLGGRVQHLHLHDNRGDHDAHLPFGMGTIDYPSVAERLARVGAAATLEIDGGSDAVRAAVATLRGWEGW